MKRQFFSTAKNFTLLLLSIILPSLLNLPPISCVRDKPYTECGILFNCGKFTGIGFPFWGGERPEECGHSSLKLGCENGTTTIQISEVKYRVLELNMKTQLLKIARNDLSRSLCPQRFVNTTLDFELFEYVPGYMNLTLLYGCPAVDFPVPCQFDCAVKGVKEKKGYVMIGSLLSVTCYASVIVPVSSMGFLNLEGLQEMVGEGFEVRYTVESGGCSECENSGGRCGYDVAGKKVVCFCSYQKAAGSETCAAGAVDAGQRAPMVADAGNYGPRASMVAPTVSGAIPSPKLFEITLVVFALIIGS